MTKKVQEMFESNAEKMRTRCEKEGHNGIRSGYYDDANSSAEAVRAMRNQLRETVGIHPGDRVLDVGCGFGDCLVWLAEEHGATGVGVDIAEPQIETARELAGRRDVTDQVEFYQQDYHDLSELESGSFDVVWSIEALMHTDRSERCLAEFADLLADNGQVVVCEPFQTEPLPSKHQVFLERLENGNEASINNISNFTIALQNNGFDSIEQRDITDEVAPGITKRAKIARWVLRPVVRIGTLVGLVEQRVADGIAAAAASGRLFGDRALNYRIVSAQYTGN